MLGRIDAFRCLSGEDLEATLSVFDVIAKHKLDQGVVAPREEATEWSTLGLGLFLIAATDRAR